MSIYTYIGTLHIGGRGGEGKGRGEMAFGPSAPGLRRL